jgi:hypothetical protein
MEFTKQHRLHLKEVIKEKVAEQKKLKPQRKTVHFKGQRKFEPWEATARHSINRYDLRHLYIAYGIMRGKTFAEIEPKAKTKYSTEKVDKILEAYGASLCSS